MTLGQWLQAAERELAQTGSPDPRADAEWMAVDVLGVTRGSLALMRASRLDDQRQVQLDSWLARRAKGEPLQYIEGTAWFMGLEFGVDPRVLIPRPDTETLCEEALDALEDFPHASVLDLCTGSGAVGISIKRLRPQARVTLTDVSADALLVARSNALKLGAPVEALLGDLFEPVAGRTFDVILCNPPYLSAEDMRNLQREVAFEPALALDGGADGLDFYGRLSAEVKDHLNPGGWVLTEVGMGQAEAVAAMLEAALGCADAVAVADLNGIERVVKARRPV